MTTEEELPKSIIVHIDRFSLSKDLQLNAFQEFKELCVEILLPENLYSFEK